MKAKPHDELARFRVAFLIAIAALLVSAIAAAALVDQTCDIGGEFAATIWPPPKRRYHL